MFSARPLLAALVLAEVVMWFSSPAHAQFCPPGSRAVAGGGGTMCQCPDGSFASIAGCPTVRQQPRQQPAPVEPRVQQFVQKRALNYAEAHKPALNRNTGRTEARLGQNVTTKAGKFWLQNLGYAGPAYVYWVEIDIYIEVPEDQYSNLYELLSSNDDSNQDAGLDVLNELRQNEGLMCCE
jgi:hypothetical protein